jgi:hypothetical protein
MPKVICAKIKQKLHDICTPYMSKNIFFKKHLTTKKQSDIITYADW